MSAQPGDGQGAVRRGHAGAVVDDGSGFVGAAFLHRTSRLADPGLHVHLLVINATQGADGRWTALDGRALYRERYTTDAVFQASLRRSLARNVGCLFDEPDRHGVAEVAGVPLAVRRAFSQRRLVIEAEMAAQGVTTAEGARIATLATRPAKGEPIEEDELRRRWAQRARELGYSIEEVPTLVREPQVSLSPADVGRRATTSDAYFTRSDVVRAVATGATQGASLDQIEAKVDEFLSSEQAVQLVDGRVWTTPEILELEQRTFNTAVADRASGVGVADAQSVEAAIAGRPSLSDEQAEMVRRFTLSGNGVDIVVGRPGSGKTFALDAVRASYEAGGYRVLGTSLAARAAKELEAGSGIPSRTAASMQAVAPGVVGNQNARMIVGDVSVVGQPASSALFLVPTSFRSAPSLPVS